jgi:hypothetical protein
VKPCLLSLVSSDDSHIWFVSMEECKEVLYAGQGYPLC